MNANKRAKKYFNKTDDEWDFGDIPLLILAA